MITGIYDENPNVLIVNMADRRGFLVVDWIFETSVPAAYNQAPHIVTLHTSYEIQDGHFGQDSCCDEICLCIKHNQPLRCEIRVSASLASVFFQQHARRIIRLHEGRE